MEEQVNEKVISMAIQSGEKAGRVLSTVISKYLEHRKNVKLSKKETNKNVGPRKMKIKDLVGTGEGINKLKFDDDRDIKMFESIARKYGVKYSINRDKTTTPPSYYFFFQSKNDEVINKAFSEYLKKTFNRDKKPSIAQAMNRLTAVLESMRTMQDKTKKKEIER